MIYRGVVWSRMMLTARVQDQTSPSQPGTGKSVACQTMSQVVRT